MKFILGAFILFVLLEGCSDNRAESGGGFSFFNFSSDAKITEKLYPHEYISYIRNRDNGLFLSKKIGSLNFSLLYEPSAFIILKDNEEGSLSKNDFKASLQEYVGMQYCTFRITSDSSGELLRYKLKDSEEYDRRVEYYSFHMQEDFKLVEGNDTLDCIASHYERVYGITPCATFTCVFPQAHDTILKDKTFVFDDKVFNSGKICLTVQRDDLLNVPGVQLKDQ